MKLNRINRVLEGMKEAGMGQLLLTDPMAIFYLTDKMLEPHERMYGLYLSVKGDHKFILNDLFPGDDVEGIDILWYNDTEDSMGKLSQFTAPESVMGVDKNMAARFLLRLMELCPDMKFVNGSFVIDLVRQIKDEEEAQKMRAVSAINDIVVKKLWEEVGSGKTELELAEYCVQLQKEYGCEDVSFEPIVAFGPNGADPHHGNDGTVGKRGDSVVLDIGGKKDSYCSDMTRTVFLGEASEEAIKVYNIVLEANKRGIRAAKPGARFCDVDNAARDYIKEMGYGEYFTHRTGHGIGLECHEAGDVSAVNEAILKPGMCFSVEPGIYLPGKFGVRIEDLVMITEDGCEVLNHQDKELTIVPIKD